MRYKLLSRETLESLVIQQVDFWRDRSDYARTVQYVDFDEARRWLAAWEEALANCRQGKDLPQICGEDLDADLLYGHYNDWLTEEDKKGLADGKTTSDGQAAVEPATESGVCTRMDGLQVPAVR